MDGVRARVASFLCGAFLLSVPAFAGLNRWTTSGPYGGYVAALVADPSRAGTAYAAVSGYGVFRTVDGGSNWVAANQGLAGAGLLPLTTVALAIDPVTTSTLYVGLQQGGAFKSDDSGATWRPIGFNDVGSYVTCITVDPQTPSTVYLCGGAGIEKSRDGGATWQPAITGMPTHPVVFKVAIDPAHPSALYARINSEGPLYRSADGGASWSPVAIPAGANYVYDLAVDASSRLFVSTDQGVFRSADSGATLVNVLAGIYFLLSVVGNDLYASGNVTDSTALAFPNAAFRSGDGGDHWAPLAVTIVPSNFAGSAPDPNTVYAGSGTGVLKSTDGGTHWDPSSHGMRALSAQPAMDPANPALVYAGGDGLFSSADGARSWSLVSSGVGFLTIQPGTLDLFSAAGRSEDGGATWRPISLPLGATVPVVAAHAPEVLFAGNAECTLGSPSPSQVLRSVDGGTTWNVSYDPHLSACTSPVVSASGRNVFASVEGFAIRDLVQSRDGGLTWSSVDTSGWPPEWWASFDVLAIDPTDENVVYALAAGKLWRSLVGGGHWQEIDAGVPPTAVPYLPFVSNLVIDPITPTTLYVSTPEGVYRGLDRGATWNPFGDGLPGGPANDLVIDATGRFLHVASGGGVYDFEISGNCAAGNAALCLLGGRFLLTVEALDPRTGRQETGHALPQTDRWGYFSLPGFTGDPNFPEILVKMADGTSLDGGFWFFHSGLTDLQYTLSVLDTVTGRQKTYQNDRSDPQRLCGGADTETFAADAPPGPVTPASRAFARPRSAIPPPSLSLLGRFTASLSAVDPRTGREASGVAIQRDDRWGYFSLPDFTGDPSFPEVFVKMLDATALPGGAFWLFHTGLTDLEYTLTVTDSTTGAQQTYRNDRSNPNRLCGGADTQAFH